jgi:AcrR family transcriptional regulator
LPELEILQAVYARVERENPCGPTSSADVSERFSSGDNLALLHLATVKLAAYGDDELLTRSQICIAAGVSRRSFDAHFTGIDDCLVSVAVQQLDPVVESVVRSIGREVTPEDRVSHGLAELCDRLARDPALAHLCFRDTVQSGEWLMRRDQLLTERFVRLFESARARIDSANGRAFEISLGAVLGLLQSEIAAGRAACLRRKAPLLAYLLLAPASSSAAMKAIYKA